MRVTLLAGLPGSGKTTLLAEWAEAGAFVVDDIVTLDALPPPPLAWLAVSDVNFCRESVRAAAERKISERYPGAEVTWTYFANEPDACRANAEARADGRSVSVDIDVLSEIYVVPAGADVRPVYRPPAPMPA